MKAANIKNGVHFYRGTGNTWRTATQYQDGEYVVLDSTQCYSEDTWGYRPNYDLVQNGETITVYGGVSACSGGHCILAGSVWRNPETGEVSVAPGRAVPLNQVRGEYISCLHEKALGENIAYDNNVLEHKHWLEGKNLVDSLTAELAYRGITTTGASHWYRGENIEMNISRPMVVKLIALLMTVKTQEVQS